MASLVSSIAITKSASFITSSMVSRIQMISTIAAGYEVPSPTEREDLNKSQSELLSMEMDNALAILADVVCKNATKHTLFNRRDALSRAPMLYFKSPVSLVHVAITLFRMAVDFAMAWYLHGQSDAPSR
jgi:hypothetical protein